MHKQGFTLIELLVVVLVVAVLAAMAMPMYQKAIEKSHMAEARNVLKAMLESKLRTLATMGVAHYGSEQVGYLQVTEHCHTVNGRIVCYTPTATEVSTEHHTFSMHALDASLCCSKEKDNSNKGKNSCLRCAGDARSTNDTNKQIGYTKSFRYSLYPSGTQIPKENATDVIQLAEGYTTEAEAIADAVCATRIGVGELAGVNFLYLGQIVKNGPKLFCYDPTTSSTGEDRCEQYGMKSLGSTAWCGAKTSNMGN